VLKRINPEFGEKWIDAQFVFRTPYAQAIRSIGFAELIPDIRTPIPNFYLSDSTLFCPEDRTISAAVRQGRRAASLVLLDTNAAH
jgi:hypothetical protein